jgi:assimilatory nitrate reductase catalytic subunit
MVPIEYTPAAEEPGGDYPFRLTTGRVVYHYLSGNQTRRLGFLNSQAPEPWVEIHPRAAGPLGIANEDRVRVRTPRGSMELKALVVPTIRPDTLFIPFHYGHREAVNLLTNPAVEPTVKIPEYKVSAAAIERLDQPERALGEAPTINYTPATAPKMFPYAVGETKAPAEAEGKHV